MKPALTLVATAAVAGVALVAAPSEARAQLKWEASGAVGGAGRLTSGGSATELGPAAQVDAHVALIPLLRAGAYLAFDSAPEDGAAARRIYAGGLRAKVMSPFPRGDFQAWLFVGVGYAAVARSEYAAIAPTTRGAGDAPVPGVVNVASAGGGFLEIPFGIGVAYKVAKPWKLQLELSGRPAAATYGSVYADRGYTGAAGYRGTLPASGTDSFGIFALVGLGFEP